MTNKIIAIHNVQDNSQSQREMNAEELAQYENDAAFYETKKMRIAEKTAIRESALAKLAALGLTADEINGLIS